MPAFTFEKISPPQRLSPSRRLGAAAPIAKKPRGFIAQILDRFAEARGKQSPREDRDGLSRRQGNASD